jgi:hypothetical protein
MIPNPQRVLQTLVVEAGRPQLQRADASHRPPINPIQTIESNQQARSVSFTSLLTVQEDFSCR